MLHMVKLLYFSQLQIFKAYVDCSWTFIFSLDRVAFLEVLEVAADYHGINGNSVVEFVPWDQCEGEGGGNMGLSWENLIT